MSTAAWLQGVLEKAFATLDFRSLADHPADDIVFEITPPKGLLLQISDRLITRFLIEDLSDTSALEPTATERA